jgi:hypothetical protein
MDKWAEHVGPELRSEGLKWMIKQKDSIKNSEMKEYTKALVSCISDKTPAIRNLAEEVVSYVMPHTGYAAF